MVSKITRTYRADATDENIHNDARLCTQKITKTNKKMTSTKIREGR